ncbi:catechol 1,2-dioxygenase [Bacillus shivajii]|uniref:dioxygenase family protein n=1 Tax=Bacillus shivajii TaxID=1983719 RepID=UPI001CFC35D6|nr:dioxygenase [Bacillus shivajii]UCZ52752.1 catechol 1,2-dioxygenase [Bacillus shivajii]
MANQRVVEIFEAFSEKAKELIEEQKITHEEYRQFCLWFDELGRSGEIPLFMDVFFESHVLRGMYGDMPGTEPSLLGPYYVDNEPELKEPFELPMRPDEKGEVFYFTGIVKSLDGKPLGNTEVCMWQADADGEYSHFADGIPEYNLRGKFKTDDQGKFTVKTVIPAPYQIPTGGPTGQFLDYIDSHPYRPAHLHFIIRAEGHDELITQVFFDGDKWLDTDVADGVRNSLISNLQKQGDHTTGALEFELRPVSVPAKNK